MCYLGLSVLAHSNDSSKNTITEHVRSMYCTVLYCTVLYCTVLYCTVPYCAVPYRTVLYCIVLYCTVLCCTVLYCAVFCCAELYCTVLYCTVPKVFIYSFIYCLQRRRHAVAQLVEALHYKSEGRGFDSRWCHWNFSLT